MRSRYGLAPQDGEERSPLLHLQDASFRTSRIAPRAAGYGRCSCCTSTWWLRLWWASPRQETPTTTTMRASLVLSTFPAPAACAVERYAPVVGGLHLLPDGGALRLRDPTRPRRQELLLWLWLEERQTKVAEEEAAAAVVERRRGTDRVRIVPPLWWRQRGTVAAAAAEEEERTSLVAAAAEVAVADYS